MSTHDTTTTASFKALADPTRRFLLDLLFERDGRTLTELESELEMTRFGVMKHLRVLEDAGLVVTRRQGREKLHFLNPVPIRLIHDRWIDKYTERRVSALADLKTQLEETGMTTTEMQNLTVQVYQVFIKATPEQIWDAITKPEFTERYFHGVRSTSTSPGRPLPAATGERTSVGAHGEVLESDPPRRLSHAGVPVRPRAGGGGAEPSHVGDRSTGRWDGAPDGHARPARGRAEDGRERLRDGLDGCPHGLKTLLETGEPL